MIMGKHFIKFKVPKVIFSTFKSCRSKHPSSLPSNPIPSFLRPNHPPPLPQPKPHPSSLKHHVSSAFVSARRSFLGPCSSREDSLTLSSPSSNFKWEKQSKWHVIAKVPDYNYDSTPPRRKIYTSAASNSEDENVQQDDVVLFPPLNLKRRCKRRRRRTIQKLRISTSSDSGLFSENSEETETLVSTDSSVSRTKHHNTEKAKKKVGRKKKLCENNVCPAPARLSEFMRKVVKCREVVVEGKVRESFAVVKKSEDPYEDFKSSMAEMVVEKQLFEREELEEMLRCFLSLNSETHHRVIVRAFVDIWEGLFCPSPKPTNR